MSTDIDPDVPTWLAAGVAPAHGPHWLDEIDETIAGGDEDREAAELARHWLDDLGMDLTPPERPGGEGMTLFGNPVPDWLHGTFRRHYLGEWVGEVPQRPTDEYTMRRMTVDASAAQHALREAVASIGMAAHQFAEQAAGLIASWEGRWVVDAAARALSVGATSMGETSRYAEVYADDLAALRRALP